MAPDAINLYRWLQAQNRRGFVPLDEFFGPETPYRRAWRVLKELEEFGLVNASFDGGTELGGLLALLRWPRVLDTMRVNLRRGRG